METNVNSYAEKYLKSTEKRMDDKNVAILGSYADNYGI